MGHSRLVWEKAMLHQRNTSQSQSNSGNPEQSAPKAVNDVGNTIKKAPRKEGS